LQVAFINETDPSDPTKTMAYTITSTDPVTKAKTEVAKRFFDNQKLNPGVEFQGLQLAFSSAPRPGDVFVLDGNRDGIGNNDNMLQLVALEKKAVVGNKTLANAYIDHINEMGNIAIAAGIAQTALTVVHEQAVGARDDLAGVSLDKEATDLIRYQQAYQAAAKSLQIASQLFDSVLQIG
jgi:flagellar hook-associated protein FlgK